MINPPSGVTAANYWNAIKAGKPTHVRITFLGQDIVLTDEDIDVSTGITVNDVLNSDTDLVFGKAVCKQVSMQILNSDALAGLIWTGEFTLEFGVEMGSPAVTEWVTVGTFSGDKPKNVTTAQTIAFDAYDRMKRFDILADGFVKRITYPTTLSMIYTSLCNYVGVSKQSGNELPAIKNRWYTTAPAEMEGYTCRDILAWIAEAFGCYAKVNAAGNVQMVWFTDNTGHSVSANEEFSVETADIHTGLTWDEADTFTWDEIETMTWNDVCGYEEAYSIDQIMLKQMHNDLEINYPYPYGGNVYMIVDNPFLTVSNGSDVTNYVKPIYDRLAEFGGYLPVSMNCIGNWCVEAGDLITISVQDNSISFPIFVKTMHWNGAVVDEYETTGQKDRSAYTSDKNKQQVLTNKEIKLYVDGNFYDIKSGIAIKEEGVEISGAKYVDIKSGSSFNVESGGIIDIHGTGTLSLTGSTVEIKSGSTFDLLSDNFVINSDSKVIIIRPDSENSWRIDENGLCLYNSTLHNKIVGISGNFMSGSSTQMVPHVGFFAYYPDGDTTHGRAAWSASDFTAHRFAYLYLEYDQTNGAKLLPQSSMANVFSIGSTDDCFEEVHARHLYGDLEHKIILIHPSSDIDRVVRILDNTDTTYSVQGYTITGRGSGTQTWNPKEIKFYGSIVAVSSRSRKHDIKRLDDAGDIIDKLKPVSFAYNNDPKNRKRLGLIYEDTIDVLPEICDPGDEKTEKSINYVELVPVLLKEIQSLRKRVKELEERTKS